MRPEWSIWSDQLLSSLHIPDLSVSLWKPPLFLLGDSIRLPLKRVRRACLSIDLCGHWPMLSARLNLHLALCSVLYMCFKTVRNYNVKHLVISIRVLMLTRELADSWGTTFMVGLGKK